MKKIQIIFIMLLLPVLAMAQFTGGNGRGDFMLGYSPCTNPENGGDIEADQTICSGTAPAPFTSVSLPSGHTGTLEYQWQINTSTPTATWEDVGSVTTTATYQHPTALTQTTWFRRLARVTCKTEWVESNTVQVTVNPSRLYVTVSGAGEMDGSSWGNAFSGDQLQYAINALCVSEVWVAAGTYTPTVEVGGSGDRYKTFKMKNGVAIYGGFAGTEDPATFDLADRDFITWETILSGDIGTVGNNSDNCYHVILNSNNGLNSTAILDGFTITAGNANGNNDSGGGGMYNLASSPKLINCTFRDNRADAGGGMYNYNSSSPNVINCSFSGNATNFLGGGMFNYNSSSPNVINCSFNGNAGGNGGGGMANIDSSPTITNCSFSGNSATLGGGMANFSSSPSVTNCIFWGNGSEIIDNQSNPTVTFSIVQGGYAGAQNLDADPRFVNAAGGNLRLLSGSPAIDAGNNAAVSADVTTDLDGNPRFVNTTVDMGAYEFSGNPCVNPTDGGDIEADQTICSGTAPAPFTSVSLPSGHTGTLEYQWQINTVSSTASFEVWENVGTNTETYEPVGTYTQTTWLRRLARVECETEWVESNTVQVTVNPSRLYVTVSGAGEMDGSSWGNAFSGDQLQYAINALCVSEVWVAAGTYTPTVEVGGSGDRYKTFKMKNGVAIYGGFAGTEDPATFDLADRDFVTCETILSGDIGTVGNNSDNCYHVIRNKNNGLNSTAILDGFTITAGNANGDSTDSNGGGIFNLASSPNVINCTFRDNRADAGGGGMFNYESSSPNVINCSFSENTADIYSGGMFNLGSSSPNVINCSFNGNASGNVGGGMANISSSPTITNCSFNGNAGGNGGGGMANISSSPTITNCSFSGNSATLGGGMANLSSSPSVTNCIFWGNGSEIFDDQSNPTVAFSIVQGGYAGTHNLNADPRFVNAAVGNLRLLSSSPAIDAGNNAAVPADVTTDLDGNPRFVNTTVDMGAYEFSGIPCVNPTTGGDIEDDQTICYNTAPATLTSKTPASGEIGALKYQWQMTIKGATASFEDWEFVGTNTDTYEHAGTLTQTTWFRRLATVECDPVGWASATASNVVEIEVTSLVPVRVNITAAKAPNGQVLFKATPVNGGDKPYYRWYKIHGSTITPLDEGENVDEILSTCKSGDEHWVEMTSSLPCAGTAESNAMCTY